MGTRSIAGAVALAALVLPASHSSAQNAPVAAPVPALSEQEAREIARDAYIYAYPMVLTEITRRVMTNVESPQGLRSPMNQIAHGRVLPDASFTDTARPGADSLCSVMFLDLSKEPMVVSVADPGGRYYVLSLRDMW